MLTNRELKLWVIACQIELELDDCSPDVGMGPSDETIVNRVWVQTGLEISSSDFSDILTAFHKWRVSQ